MDEESVNLSVTTQQNNLADTNSDKGSVERRSTMIRNNTASTYGKASLASSYDGDSPGRNFSKKSSSASNSQKAIPNYLRASTGSCHDFCKYGGRKDIDEEKPWRRLSKKILKPPSNQSIARGSMVNDISSPDSKTRILKHKPSHDSKSFSCDSPKIFNQDVSLPSKRVKASPKQELVSEKEMSTADDNFPKVETSPKQESATEKKMTKTVRKSDNVATEKTKTARKSDNFTKVDEASPKQELATEKIMTKTARKVDSFVKVKGSPKQELVTEKKMTATLRKIVTFPKQELVTEKKITNVEKSDKDSPTRQPKSATVKSSSSSDISEGSVRRGRRNSVVNNGKTTVALKEDSLSSARPLNRNTISSKLSKNINLKLVSPPKDQSRARKAATIKPKNVKITEETLFVDTTQSGDVLVELPTPSDQSPESSSHLHSSLLYTEEDKLHVVETEIASNPFELVDDGDSSASIPDPSDQSSRSLSELQSLSSEEEEEVDELLIVETETVSNLLDSVHDKDVAASLSTPSDESPKSLSQPHASLSSHGNDELDVVKAETVSNLFETDQNGNVAASLPIPSDQSPKSLSQPHSSLSSHGEDELQVKTETVSNLFEIDQNGDVAASLPHEKEEREEKEIEEEMKEEDKIEVTGHSYNEAGELTEEEEEDEDEEEEEEEDDDEEEEEEYEEEDETGHTDYEATELSSNHDEANLNEQASAKDNYSRTVKKQGAVVSKDKYSVPTKLKFRRGKVVELQSEENNAPRKLKFKRGRVLGVNRNSTSVGNSDVTRRNFKKRVVDDKDGTDPSDVTVVLRHQGLHDSKNTQGLLNNVIEETATKLVGSRRSKVKALVGAFETVISLR